MKKRQLDHLLRAAGRITGETEFIVIGSQALHGKAEDIADEILMSFEADLIARNHPDRTDWLNVIGVASPFHEEFGYYADPVDEKTATLPAGWKQRLIPLPPGDNKGVTGYCLEPHDLAISKLVANREKDVAFVLQMIKRGLASKSVLLERLAATPAPDAVKEAIRARLQRVRTPRGASRS
ncbi:MAG: hypothetical protein JNM79_03150 [Burkholderiales bacterium]|nr:hypothetical protein [Burkholderiales bacterium]